jgi:hypothetical protein
MSFSTTVPAMGELIMPAGARNRPAGLEVFDDLRIKVQRDERLQCGVAVRLGVRGVGLRLFFFALGHAVVLNQILVHVGHAGGSLGGGERLAISADGRRKVG